MISTACHCEMLTAAAALLAFAASGLASTSSPADRIRPWEANPRYWQYKGKPILLLGGSKDDNLFQIPDLEAHLDEMQEVGANYIRNTMSDRPDFGYEVYPFKRLPNGQYDLGQWNDEYWRRFEAMLRLTRERDIIVQIELWDRFDYSDSKGKTRWGLHPYNPKNNVTYAFKESGFRERYPKHPGANDQPFFFTPPGLKNNQVVLEHQVAQVDKMLSYALQHPHVLYCIDNETSGSPKWGRFWSAHIKRRAAAAGVEVHTTEMWDNWNPKGMHHRRTLDHPETYSFVDVSQNNHNKGQKHWDNFQWVWRYIAPKPRPINTVKIYGADTGRFGNGRDAQERFWRNILAGAAGTRFHRPDSGLGLCDIAKAHIRSMRLLAAELDVFRCTADGASKLLTDRSPNEAYLTCIPGQQYVVYFPNGGSVGLDLTNARGIFAVKWLDIMKSEWGDARRVEGGKVVRLRAPGQGHWAALIRGG